jgi:hypothetical protein
MQLIRCTAKLLKEIGLKPSQLQQGEPDFSFLGQWHANLIYIDRRKSLIFVNDRTLMNFVVPGTTRAQIRELPDLFLSTLACVLSAEDVPGDTQAKVLAEYEEIGIAKSSSRSVLGSANDIAFHYKYSIEEAGGVHSWRIPEIIHDLNRMPMQAINYKFPIVEFRHLYDIAV